MNLWLGFLPWIVFWTIISRWSVPTGAWISLALCLIVNIRSFWRRCSKIFEIGSFIFFFLLCVDIIFIKAQWLHWWIFTIQNASLLIIILISIAAGKSFSEQYAHDLVARDLWDSPEVIRACRVINTIWIVSLVVLTVGSVSRVLWAHPVPWVFSVTHMAIFFPVMQFTNRKLKKLKFA